MKNKNYGILNLSLIDRLIENKRTEMLNILQNKIKNFTIESFLDIGTTEENNLDSSNFFVKQFNNIKIKKSISIQNIEKKNFTLFLKKSITKDFLKNEINDYKSDLVVSSATLEHVGSFENQLKMMNNIISLTNKVFFVTTPYRNFPIDFHTKLPLIHMLPKKIHRNILNFLNLKDYAKEENLNLLDFTTLNKIINLLKLDNFEIIIVNLRLFGLISNIMIYGEKKL
jgi:hypothetical protein